jgi:hypothetical protein
VSLPEPERSIALVTSIIPIVSALGTAIIWLRRQPSVLRNVLIAVGLGLFLVTTSVAVTLKVAGPHVATKAVDAARMQTPDELDDPAGPRTCGTPQNYGAAYFTACIKSLKSGSIVIGAMIHSIGADAGQWNSCQVVLMVKQGAAGPLIYREQFDCLPAIKGSNDVAIDSPGRLGPSFAKQGLHLEVSYVAEYANQAYIAPDPATVDLPRAAKGG